VAARRAFERKKSRVRQAGWMVEAAGHAVLGKVYHATIDEVKAVIFR